MVISNPELIEYKKYHDKISRANPIIKKNKQITIKIDKIIVINFKIL